MTGNTFAPAVTNTDDKPVSMLQERRTLPELLSQAAQRLLDARSSGEVLEAKKIAEMALHLARLTKAANETHADCLRVITRAEMRMADEIDRGQRLARWRSPVVIAPLSETKTMVSQPSAISASLASASLNGAGFAMLASLSLNRR